MSSETLNLLLGAGIALLSSLVTAIITHSLQMKREKRKRAWDLEDHRRNQRSEILKERIAQAEAWVESYVRFIDEAQFRIIFAVGQDAEGFQEWLRSAIKTPRSDSHKKAAIYRLDDPDLLELVKTLDQYWIDTAEVLRPVLEGHEEINVVVMTLGLRALFDDILKTYGEFLGRLDQLRTQMVGSSLKQGSERGKGYASSI